MTVEVEKLYQEKLDMYPHLKNIRTKLWASEGKSRVSVMIGAGFSLNAKKIEESMEGMAVWNDLKRRLIRDLSHHKDIEQKDVLEIGQIYVKEYGRSSLDEILKSAIPDDNYEPDKLHYNLLKLPWTDIYTTNYDTLLERAKKHVYERNYQVVYDISDIPSSVSPRIIKLHGSFPANRPFVFTTNDYEDYPKKFSPFVNMVQQSIMETVFVLIGFSGDDPNFERWTTWVSQNLGEHMPKIYMIGYGQKERKSELADKGITLIDFECIYHKHENPFHQMFTDVFKFFEYKEREEKIKWPHRTYSQFDKGIEKLKYNRETYPGWIVMPDEIRREHAKEIRNLGRNFLDNSQKEVLGNEMFAGLNEILWCYEKFAIPLEYDIHKKLQDLVDKQNQNEINKNLYPLILRLFKEARLDCDQKNFKKYKNILENLPLGKEQQHYFTYEQVLYHLNFCEIETVENLIQQWNVDSKEIEWGIKKAVIIARINRKDKAKKMFEEYLQVIRKLLSIKPDDYRLLSLESIALHNRNKITREWDYGYDRLRYLSGKYCDSNKEFDRAVISIKKYENNLGAKEWRGFDPGTKNSTVKFGDYMKQELIDSYAVLQMQDTYALTINDELQYNLALKNIEIFHSCYSQIKRINRITIKEMDEIFRREDVYVLDDHMSDILVYILKNVISNKNRSHMNINVALEILSRIYLALSLEKQKEVDIEVLKFIDSEKSNGAADTSILVKLIKRIFFAKNREQSKVFCEQIMNTKIKVQHYTDKSEYQSEFFEPLLEIFDKREHIFEINVSDEQLEKLFKYLKNEVDYSIRESALIRLTFLELTRSLSGKYRSRFISNIQELSKDRKHGISDFIFSSTFDKIIYSNETTSKQTQEEFMKKSIPQFYSKGTWSYGLGVRNYFRELQGIFVDFIGSKEKQTPKSTVYKQWLEKFYVWWESQKEGLLRNSDDENSLVKDSEYLTIVIVALKNNIWGAIPKAYLDANDRNKAKQIFNEIYERKPDMSIYLIASLHRLSINIDYPIEELLNRLWDSNITKVKASVKVLYDYMVFIDKGEIKEETTTIKRELFSMMKYGSKEVRKMVLDSIRYTMKNTSTIFDMNDYKVVIQYANNYLQGIKEGDVEVSTRDDFELISSFASLIAYICKSKEELVGSSFDEWKDYIRSHRLPEVRTYADMFDGV
ncbi:TPA: SIR2 family protein [Bacillus pseudomycoides]|nr:SIR2 family protein [Bacillus pseudomycoides]